MIDLSISTPTKTVVRVVVVDPGADEIILPERVATLLNLDLTSAPIGTSQGVGSPAIIVRYYRALLRLSDGQEHRTWSADVGFSSALQSRGLFGITQGLQYFTATFDGDTEEVQLKINRHYPGT